MNQTTNQLSRREMILASGVIVTALAESRIASAQSPEAEKDLIFRTTDPRNAEPELNKLIASWLTPTKHFYVRSHAPNPEVDVAKFRVQIDGMVDRPASLSLDELKRNTEHTVTATLTCAGNRRKEFNAEGEVGGVQWEAGAIGNATWTGVALSDVLKQVGVQPTAKHVWFEGMDQIPKGDEVITFGASIPIEKAMGGEGDLGALLVYKMNGETLAPDHGYPLRTIVPGYIGARSVKWLSKIVVSDRTSPNHYLATAYKIVKDTSPLDWSEAGPIYRYPINAAIGSVEENAQLKAGKIQLSGYVLPSGILGTRVAKVLVSTDAGKSWQQAELTGEDGEFCWQLWSADVNVTQKTKELIVRALDTSGGFMPARVPWNAKGYLQNSWYRIPVTVN